MPDPPTLRSQTLETRAARSADIWEARQRASQRTVDEFETVDDPRDVPVRRQGEGFGPAPSFLEWAEPREAAHQLDPEFPRQDLGPADVREAEGGFRPVEPVQRRAAAFEFEATTALGDVDPQADLARRDDGFGLVDNAQRELGAAKLDPQFPDVAIGPSDVEPTGEGAFGLAPSAERAVAAERLEDETPLGDVAPGDVTRADSGWQLEQSVIDANAELFR